jgi:hypothetical protein
MLVRESAKTTFPGRKRPIGEAEYSKKPGKKQMQNDDFFSFYSPGCREKA